MQYLVFFSVICDVGLLLFFVVVVFVFGILLNLFTCLCNTFFMMELCLFLISLRSIPVMT